MASSEADTKDSKLEQYANWSCGGVPFCSLFLVVSTILCHFFCLMGNLDTADSFVQMGKSTGGWSDVGLSMSESMISEVEYLMGETNHMLTIALKDVVEMEGLLNFVLGATGNATELAVRMYTDGNPQVKYVEPPGGVLSVLALNGTLTAVDKGPVNGAVKKQVSDLINKVSKKVEEFWKMMRPALVQVGKWLHSMGAKMQGFIEQFSQTLDKAQKIFDQLMKKLAGKAHKAAKEQMVYNTFHIFDMGKGDISEEDIQTVASLYGITALSGAKGKELHKKYDADGDGKLSVEEYSLLVDDKSVPDVMSYVLRTFSKKLSQVAGQMKGSKKRDELGQSVVEYFQLMVAKNISKVEWVSDALTNGSLPIEFSADVFKQLVEQEHDPGKLTDLPVGKTIIGYMMDLNHKFVGKVVKELADPVYWHKQGFDSKQQGPTVKQVKKWIHEAHEDKKAKKSHKHHEAHEKKSKESHNDHDHEKDKKSLTQVNSQMFGSVAMELNDRFELSSIIGRALAIPRACDGTALETSRSGWYPP